MRRIWASGAVLALVVGGFVVAADDDSPPQSGFGARNVYHPVDKPKAEKPPAQPKIDPEEAKLAKINPVEESKAYSRRLAVCDKLRAIAVESHDADLEREVDRLESRVNTLYQQRTDRMVKDEKAAAPKSSRNSGKDVASTGPREVAP